MRSRLTDRLFDSAVVVCGAIVGLSVAGIFCYLALESRYAFDRKFPYGMRFAAQSPSAPQDELLMDPNATLLTAHMDGMDGLDDKDSAITAPTLSELSGVATAATGTALATDTQIPETGLFRDDWRAAKRAGQGDTFVFYAYATPEHTEPTLRVRWEPDAAFDPDDVPFRLKLKLLRAPEGVNAPTVDVDLSAHPTGHVDLPSWVAKTDGDREHGYAFQMMAEPLQRSNAVASLAGFLRSNWAPTSQYPRYGFFPLLASTLLMTLLAVLIASLPALAGALYLSEFAPHRVRVLVQPIIEMLAAVPTVVLGYFGLMVVAPSLMKGFGEAFQMESGRSLLSSAIMLAVLILPLMTTLAQNALRSLPQHLHTGAIGLGLTPLESVRKVLLPAARSRLAVAPLLGFSRAAGETMIVWILAGGTVTMPALSAKGLMQPSKGVADTIGIEMANVEFEGAHYGHLFLIGLVLFAITIVFNVAGNRLAKVGEWRA